MNALTANGAHVFELASSLARARSACDQAGPRATPGACDLADLGFPIKGTDAAVRPNQLRKMKRASQQRDRKLAANEDVSAGEMLLISPDRMRNAQITWPVIE